MSNNYPKKLKIGAIDYTVHLLEPKEVEQYGVCLYEHQRIYLSRNMLHQQASDTLLHEVLHAIWNEAGLDHIPDLNEETIVRTMSTWLRIVFVNNPNFAKFVLNAEDSWNYGPKGNPDLKASWHLSSKDEEEEDDE
jgi:hypothetical protein